MRKSHSSGCRGCFKQSTASIRLEFIVSHSCRQTICRKHLSVAFTCVKREGDSQRAPCIQLMCSCVLTLASQTFQNRETFIRVSFKHLLEIELNIIDLKSARKLDCEVKILENIKNCRLALDFMISTPRCASTS